MGLDKHGQLGIGKTKSGKFYLVIYEYYQAIRQTSPLKQKIIINTPDTPSKGKPLMYYNSFSAEYYQCHGNPLKSKNLHYIGASWIPF